MLKIGFANKFYTLWDVSETCLSEHGNCKEIANVCNYIKNISYDLNVVREKYPDIEIWEALKGKHISFVTEPKRVYTDIETFRFGKYDGKRIDEVNDAKYVLWYVNEIYDEDHKMYVESVLLNTYNYIKYNDCFVTENEYNEIVEEENARKEFLNRIKNNEPIEYTPIFNLSEYCVDGKTYGSFIINDVTFVFTEIVENWYNGFPYYLPTINGKGKRIKNKTLVITDYTFNGETVYVNKWSIKK